MNRVFASKHWKCCTGDCKWGNPYSSLPHAVVHSADGKGSFSQLWVNALHIFPDLVFLYPAAGKDWTEDDEYWWTGPTADG
jgi:hypothetical protein